MTLRPRCGCSHLTAHAATQYLHHAAWRMCVVWCLSSSSLVGCSGALMMGGFRLSSICASAKCIVTFSANSFTLSRIWVHSSFHQNKFHLSIIFSFYNSFVGICNPFIHSVGFFMCSSMMDPVSCILLFVVFPAHMCVQWLCIFFISGIILNLFVLVSHAYLFLFMDLVFPHDECVFFAIIVGFIVSIDSYWSLTYSFYYSSSPHHLHQWRMYP